MRRKSKGQKEREEKLTRREQKSVNDILNDPFFKGLNVPQQLKLTSFIRENVEEQLRQAEVAGYEKGMIDTMACAIQVLLEDYWKKTGEKRIPDFVVAVTELVDSELRQVVTWQEMVDYVNEKTGLNMQTDWLGEDKRPTPRKLFFEK